MQTLDKNWLTDGLIDLEYKKYLLLAYLQQVTKNFDERKLYPKFTELAAHYHDLQFLKEQKMAVAKDLPKEISRLDLEKLKIEYKEAFEDDDLMREIDSIIQFAIPALEAKISIGKELFEEVEHKLEVFPVGILPLRTDEGYLFLSDILKKLVNVYYYQVTIFESIQEKYRSIRTQHLFKYTISVTNSYEKVKYRLIKQNAKMPTPATYAVEFKQSFPLPETMLPIAGRSLVRFISG